LRPPYHPCFAASLRQVWSKPALGDFELFVIGDTHGSMRFLCQALLATGKFALDPGRVRDTHFNGVHWSTAPDDQFKVVITGDVVDRGHHDRKMLLMLKRLTEHPTHGHQLQLLLGNHEEMILQHDHRYAPELDVRTVHATNKYIIQRRRPERLSMYEKRAKKLKGLRHANVTKELIDMVASEAILGMRPSYFADSLTLFDREAGFLDADQATISRLVQACIGDGAKSVGGCGRCIVGQQGICAVDSNQMRFDDECAVECEPAVGSLWRDALKQYTHPQPPASRERFEESKKLVRSRAGASKMRTHQCF
jgi:hypothetical protein